MFLVLYIRSVLLPSSRPPPCPHSLTHSPTHSLTPSLPPSLPRSVTPSLPHSLTLSLPHSLPHSLTPSLPHSLTPSLPPLGSAAFGWQAWVSLWHPSLASLWCPLGCFCVAGVGQCARSRMYALASLWRPSGEAWDNVHCQGVGCTPSSS